MAWKIWSNWIWYKYSWMWVDIEIDTYKELNSFFLACLSNAGSLLLKINEYIEYGFDRENKKG